MVLSLHYHEGASSVLADINKLAHLGFTMNVNNSAEIKKISLVLGLSQEAYAN